MSSFEDSDFDEEEAFQSPTMSPVTSIKRPRTVSEQKEEVVPESIPPPPQDEEELFDEEGEASSMPLGVASTSDVVDAPEKKKSKGAGKKRKREPPSEDGNPKTTGVGKKTKNDILLEDFTIGTLPALRRDMKKAKANQAAFKIKDHSSYFGKTSKHIPTFILPLFHFLGREEIICSRVCDFNGKKFIKTDAGFAHASFIINHALDLTEEEKEYLLRKYGKEYFKIPSKDFVKASSASKYGDKGEFKVVLTGLYEDSFMNDDQIEIATINPILRYESVKPKPTTGEKKEKK